MIDPKKKYKTRDGREVRIYAVDGGGHQPIHGAIRDGDAWISTSWLQGGVGALHINSLIEVRPRIKREVWVNVYRHEDVFEMIEAFDTREDADAGVGDARLACVKLVIDCEEGEGL